MPLSAQQMAGGRARAGVGRVGVVDEAMQTQVLATGVADPYDTSLHASGLSVYPCAPGSTVGCLFTVTHERPITGIELHPAIETWTGCVVDNSSGLVILLMSYFKTTLWNGAFTTVRLTSTGVLAKTTADADLTVYAGPWEQFQGLNPGAPFSGAGGVLSAAVTVGSAPNPSLPSTPGSSTTVTSAGGSFWSTPWGTGTLVAGGLLVVVGGGVIAYHAAASPEVRDSRRRLRETHAAMRYEQAAAQRAREERAPSYGPAFDADWSEA